MTNGTVLGWCYKTLASACRTASADRPHGWLAFSLVVASVPAVKGLFQAFAGPTVFQDDARQHIFWMHRFEDATLFPGDLIADYLQGIAPVGFTAVYWLAAQLGLEPLLFNKILPLILGLTAAYFAFRLATALLPLAAAGFITSCVLIFGFWLNDSMSSGTPRGFIYPLLLAFLYAVQRRSLTGTVVAGAAMVLTYPSIALFAMGVLGLCLLRWDTGMIRITRDKRDWWLSGLGLLTMAAFLAPYAIQSKQFGAVVTVAEARDLPVLLTGGRMAFFDDDPWRFYMCRKLSGFLPFEWGCMRAYKLGNLALAKAVTIFGLIVTFGLPYWLYRRAQNATAPALQPSVGLLMAGVLSAMVLFVAAHLLLFDLYLPSRFSMHSLRIIIGIAVGLTATLILCALIRWAGSPTASGVTLRQSLVLGIAALWIGFFILFPVLYKRIPVSAYKEGGYPQLYAFLKTQPKNTVVATLSMESNNLPLLAQRSVLLGSEVFLPWNRDYFLDLQKRAHDLLIAHYTPDDAALASFIKDYGIGAFLIEDGAFSKTYLKRNWVARNAPQAVALATRSLQNGGKPALERYLKSCASFRQAPFTLVSASCVLEHAAGPK